MPKVSIIVAVSRNGVIGRNGELPWRLSADLKRFKQLTMDKSIVMGRKTFESIGRLLPGRTMIVLTRQADWSYPGVHVADSLATALALEHPNPTEVFIIGGAQLYESALPIADRLYLTRVETEIDGDTKFPEWDESNWKIAQQEHVQADELNEFATTFLVYDRKTRSVTGDW